MGSFDSDREGRRAVGVVDRGRVCESMLLRRRRGVDVDMRPLRPCVQGLIRKLISIAWFSRFVSLYSVRAVWQWKLQAPCTIYYGQGVAGPWMVLVLTSLYRIYDVSSLTFSCFNTALYRLRIRQYLVSSGLYMLNRSESVGQ